MGTIVQEYGPIYGEAVNGTVQGRPNGSVYVPEYNTIDATTSDGYVKYLWGTHYAITNSLGVQSIIKVVAKAQDPTSYMATALYSDAACTVRVGNINYRPAGQFNANVVAIAADSSNQLVTGNTYYVQAVLYNNGSAVAASTPIALEAL